MSIQSTTAGVVLAALFSAHASATSVWINEIHYDNTGGDVGEFVEIAGTAGTDLTGWSLVLYNGSASNPYNTEPLSGALSDDTGTGLGFSTVGFGGIQNGAPDGLALVDSGDDVIQLLSYEGTFTALSGVADGVTSVDIGVFEAADTPDGFSLQLLGFGSNYDEFAWAGPLAGSPGALNAGQTFVDVRGGVDSGQPLSTVPLPGSLPLFVGALGVMGLLGRRTRTD